MKKHRLPLSRRKELHERWSEIATGSKDGLPFDPNSPAFIASSELPSVTHAYGKKGCEIHVRSGI